LIFFDIFNMQNSEKKVQKKETGKEQREQNPAYY